MRIFNIRKLTSLFPLNAWNKSLPNCLATLLDTESRLTEKILIGLDFSLEKTPSAGRLKLARSSVHLRIPPDDLTLIGYFKTSILNVLLISRLQIFPTPQCLPSQCSQKYSIRCALHQLTLLLPVINEMLIICRELTVYIFNCVSINIKDWVLD